MASKTSKLKTGNFDQNPIEAVRDIGQGVIDSLKRDLGPEEVTNTLWRQLLKPTAERTRKDASITVEQSTREDPRAARVSGDLEEGQEIDIFKKEQWARVEPGINYHDSFRKELAHFGEKARTKETKQLRTKVEEIQLELMKLSKSSQELKVVFKDISVQTLPEAPGKYHLNFFEWILATIRTARMQIEESASWLSVVSGKKNKKNYWTLAQKHGTSFSLSGERVVAQQVG